MSILFMSINIVITIVGLIFIYRKREVEEANLGWKVFGYSFLGAFTFRLNNFPLPIGFFIYLLIFHPKINRITKRKAAYLGLIIFILGAMYPFVENYLIERPREIVVASSNVYTLNFSEDWKKIQKKLNIVEDARLNYFNILFKPDGKIESLDYELVGIESGASIIYSIELNPDTKQYRILRHKRVENAPVYQQSVSVTHLFEVLNQVGVKNMMPKTIYDQYLIHAEGRIYKERMTDQMVYLIEDGGKVKKVTYEELPSGLSTLIVEGDSYNGNSNPMRNFYYYSPW